MTAASILFLILLACVIVIFITELFPVDLTALVALLAFVFLGFIEVDKAFRGFSSPAVITMMATFFLGAALRITGVADLVARQVHLLVGQNELYNTAAVMLLGALLSAFMTNVAAVAVLLPAVVSIAHHAEIAPSRLLLPLAFSTVLGGTVTLIGTTPNILIGDLMANHGLKPFAFFSFAPIGILFVLFGTVTLCIFGRVFLPNKSSAKRKRKKRDLRKLYRLEERLFSLNIGEGSELVGRTIADSGLRANHDLHILAILRDGERILTPAAQKTFKAKDVVIVRGKMSEANALTEEFCNLTIEDTDTKYFLESDDIEIIEVILSPRSEIIGKTLKELSFHDRYGYQVLALWREGKPVRSRVAVDPLQFGDALLLQGPKEKRPVLRGDDDFVILSGAPVKSVKTNKAPAALLALAVTIVLAVSNFVPVHIAAFCGAAITVLFGAITMSDAYKEIEWRIIFLIACLIPIGGAVESTGVAEYFARELLTSVGFLGPIAILIVFSLFSSFLSQTLDGTLAVVLLTPISLEVAKASEMNPYALLMTITLSASVAFLTPFSHKANLLVMGAGGYRVKDYFRVGLLLTVVTFATLWIMIPILYPL